MNLRQKDVQAVEQDYNCHCSKLQISKKGINNEEAAVVYLKLRHDKSKKREALVFANKTHCKTDTTQKYDGPKSCRSLRLKHPNILVYKGWELTGSVKFESNDPDYIFSHKDLLISNKIDDYIDKSVQKQNRIQTNSYTQKINTINKYFSEINQQYGITNLPRSSQKQKINQLQAQLQASLQIPRHYIQMDDVQLYETPKEMQFEQQITSQKKKLIKIVRQQNVLTDLNGFPILTDIIKEQNIKKDLIVPIKLKEIQQQNNNKPQNLNQQQINEIKIDNLSEQQSILNSDTIINDENELKQKEGQRTKDKQLSMKISNIELNGEEKFEWLLSHKDIKIPQSILDNALTSQRTIASNLQNNLEQNPIATSNYLKTDSQSKHLPTYMQKYNASTLESERNPLKFMDINYYNQINNNKTSSKQYQSQENNQEKEQYNQENMINYNEKFDDLKIFPYKLDDYVMHHLQQSNDIFKIIEKMNDQKIDQHNLINLEKQYGLEYKKIIEKKKKLYHHSLSQSQLRVKYLKQNTNNSNISTFRTTDQVITSNQHNKFNNKYQSKGDKFQQKIFTEDRLLQTQSSPKIKTDIKPNYKINNLAKDAYYL